MIAASFFIIYLPIIPVSKYNSTTHYLKPVLCYVGDNASGRAESTFYLGQRKTFKAIILQEITDKYLQSNANEQKLQTRLGDKLARSAHSNLWLSY